MYFIGNLGCLGIIQGTVLPGPTHVVFSCLAILMQWEIPVKFYGATRETSPATLQFSAA